MFDEVQLEQIWPKVDMDGEIAKNEAETLSEEIDQFEDQFDSFEEINESSLSSLCFSQKSDVDLSSSKETRKMITAQESRKLNQRNKGESKTEYECDKCGKKLKRKHSVRLHMVVHDNAFVKHSYLPCHLRRKHCEKKYQKQSSKQMKSSFQCDICGKELLNANKLIYHMGTIHTDGEFKCKLCDHIAKNKYQQNTHFTRVHKRDRCCEICGHWFSSKDFGLHMKPKNHVYPYTCSVEGCLRAFTTTNGLGKGIIEQTLTLNSFDFSSTSNFFCLFNLDAHERFFHKKVLMVRSARYVTEHFQRYRNFNELLRQIKSNLFVNLTIFSLSNFSSRSFFAAKVCDSCGIRSKLKSIIKLSRDLIK